jgi:3-hydroxy-9,10-secoandrosta-1,3,5(10)-triene-9,17-dione monooxygenase reductase component
MSRVPTSVVIVAAMHDSEPVGMVVGTFTSVSVDPVLVGYLGERSSRTVSLLLAADQVSCSLLHESQLDLVTAFERPAGSRFDGVAWEVEDQFNVPVFAGAPLTVFGCPAGVTEAGDHLFALIEVLGVHTMGPARPLTFCGGRLNRMDPGPMVDRGIWQLGLRE